MSRTSLGTAIAAAAWVAVCTYLYFAWPSLSALLETLDSPSGSARWLAALPRLAFVAFGLLAVLCLALKDRWLHPGAAVLVDALFAAPPLTAIAFLVYPFLVPLE